jgi:hypothetical protein
MLLIKGELKNGLPKLWFGVSTGLRWTSWLGGGPVVTEVIYDPTKLTPCWLPPKHEAIPEAQEVVWDLKSEGEGIQDYILKRLLSYQQETAEKTPMAATVCSSVSFFACIVHRDSAGLVVWPAAYRSHRGLLCDADRSDRGKLSALLAQQKLFSGVGGREGNPSPARQIRRGPPPTRRGLLVGLES